MIITPQKIILKISLKINHRIKKLKQMSIYIYSSCVLLVVFGRQRETTEAETSRAATVTIGTAIDTLSWKAPKRVFPAMAPIRTAILPTPPEVENKSSDKIFLFE